MSLLCLFQLVIEMNQLLIDHCVTELLLLFVQLLLANLLLSPVSHLQRLHPDSVAITCKKRFSKDVRHLGAPLQLLEFIQIRQKLMHL